jgi:hypothetical protein
MSTMPTSMSAVTAPQKKAITAIYMQKNDNDFIFLLCTFYDVMNPLNPVLRVEATILINIYMVTTVCHYSEHTRRHLYCKHFLHGNGNEMHIFHAHNH